MQKMILLCLLSLPGHLFAGESSIEFARSIDNNGNQDTAVALEFGLSSDALLYLSVARNRSITDVSQKNVSDVRIGYEGDPAEDIFYGIEWSGWGAPNDLVVSSLRGSINVQSDTWLNQLVPQLRTIRFYITIGSNPYLDVTSPGFQYSATYLGWENWKLSISYMLNLYSRNLTILASDPRVLLFFSPTTLDLASGFEYSQFGIDVGYRQKWGDIAWANRTSRSAIDFSLIRTNVLRAGWNLSPSWYLGLQTGRSVSELDSRAVNFLAWSARYYW